MKKVTILIIICVITFSSSTFAQNSTASWGGKGTAVVNAGYGFGNSWKKLFKQSGTKLSVTGPVGIGFEYGVSQKIGVGLQAGYSKLTATAPRNSSSYTSTETLTSFQAFARANYHFGKSDKFDPYVGLGLGIGSFKYNYKDNDPTADPSVIFAVPASFGITGALGARYYFTNQIGAYAEVGLLAGSIAQVGLVAKF